MTQEKISGVLTALITPFTETGKVDFDSFAKLLNHQIENGIDGFIVNGTTAESPNLYRGEIEKLFDATKKIAGSRPIVVGTGSNSTTKTIEATKWAGEIGADAALVVVPYYNKPTQEGLVEHLSLIHI